MGAIESRPGLPSFPSIDSISSTMRNAIRFPSLDTLPNPRSMWTNIWKNSNNNSLEEHLLAEELDYEKGMIDGTQKDPTSGYYISKDEKSSASASSSLFSMAYFFGKTIPVHDTDVWKATLEADSDWVYAYLKNNNPVDVFNIDGDTPIHIACRMNHCEILVLLIEWGSDIHARSRDGCTPLMIASAEGSTRCVNRLLNVGANVHMTSFDGRTALHYACGDGNEQILEMLLKRKANVNARDVDQRTPLHFACIDGSAVCVRRLLQCRNIEIHSPDAFGRTALNVAQHCHYNSIITLIEKYERRRQINRSDIVLASEYIQSDNPSTFDPPKYELVEI